MKCKYCGSNLTIDDEKCPFCGKDNPFAVKHRKEMRSFSRQFQKTKDSVFAKTNLFTGWTVRITVIAVLVALNVIMLLMLANTWEIREFLDSRKINSNLNIHIKNMEQLEENRDYIGITKYYHANRLILSDRFDEYEVLDSLCSNYYGLYCYLPGINGDNLNDYVSKEEQAESISHQIYNIYQYSKKDKFSKEECFSKEHIDTMNALKEHINYMLMTYCNVSKEDIEMLPTLSKARIQIIIERGLGIDG